MNPLVALAIVSLGVVSDPQVSPDGAAVLFTVTTGRTSVTWRVSTAGSPAQRFPDDTTDAAQARWSPDGRRVVYISGGQVWIASADGRDPHRLTALSGGVASPIWSPDGASLAFTSKTGARTDLLVISADGGPAARLATDADGYTFSPDGKELAFSRNGVVSTIPATAGPFVGHDPIYSPDGCFLAYQSPAHRLIVYDRRTHDTTEILRSWDHDAEAYLFAPDNSILVGSVDSGRQSLYRVHLPAGVPAPLLTGWNDAAFSLAADGRTIAWVRDAAEVYAGTLGPDGITQVRQLSHINDARSSRQSLDDAWWTGSVQAAGAATLPAGHVLLEPYFYDVIAGHSNTLTSRTYLIYGLLDRVSIGVIPIAGYDAASAGFEDLTAQAQYRLTQFHVGSWVPTTSVLLQETFPTGQYDRLGRPSDGFGAGAYTTTLALYSQTYFWMPNGRILRARLDVQQSVYSTRVNVADASVYGTTAGFRGHALPGASTFVDLAGEYSLTRHWVLALDANEGWNGDTRVAGPASVIHSGSSEAIGFTPALEYNWNPHVGVIVGARAIEIVRRTARSVTPVIAINMVR